MYIRRKVFSIALDENGEERLFSTKDTTKSKSRDISRVDSHRGLGRSLLLGGPGGAVGAYLTKDEATKLAKEGKSDEEIVNAVGKSGLKKGAAINAGLGALSGVQGGVKGALAGAGGAAISGGIGGLLGARKNAKTRLRKYRESKKD